MANDNNLSLGAELQHLAVTYSHLFLRAADAFIIWDERGYIQNANQASCLLTGYDKNEILDFDIRKLFPDNLTKTLGDLTDQCKKEEDGNILYEGESEIIPKDGFAIPVTLRFIAVHHPDNGAVLGIIHDIRDLKDLEARLALSQARYKGIVENINEVILLLDNDGKILFTNNSGEEILGQERHALVNSNIRALVKEKDLPLLEKILAGDLEIGESSSEQPTLKMITAENTEKEFALFITNIPSERNLPGGILAIMHDITGLKELQEKLNYAERMQNVENILSKITHEVKNPLAAINASAEFLRRHWDVSEEDKKEVVELIADETNRINRVITEYLRIRRIPRATFLHYEIKDVVETVEKSLEKLLDEHPNISLTTDVDQAKFAFDGDMFKQILWNLINNAIDAVGNSGSIHIKGIRSKDDSIYQLDITDDGCGMDEETQKKIFDPFYTNKEHGTGIGLVMVKQHLDAMKGEIELESEPEKGTTFRILLPMVKEEDT